MPTLIVAPVAAATGEAAGGAVSVATGVLFAQAFRKMLLVKLTDPKIKNLRRLNSLVIYLMNFLLDELANS
ncbi:hypothetical protein [Nostoc sp. ChiQUE01b]|uniref:hypothetical protein n=1 Tax=Nostoc sp. ChiQUE01b TaxID=3075376 RepID=UPI002AD3EFE3|nr:hypothetical protein [Nostoc sp. ChiQUE01b]MDZ8236959.1 hypothetical protein [Nostoc sp. ChiQUE01a]MDZ8262687.1 hypothetical protein [Nostoc sp. ChiQUE01b]MDZ8262719.1 hypothetical protein [Nostoc sp. ChiQUE01b]